MNSKFNIEDEKDSYILIFMVLILSSFILFRSNIISFFVFLLLILVGAGILVLRAKRVRTNTK